MENGANLFEVYGYRNWNLVEYIIYCSVV